MWKMKWGFECRLLVSTFTPVVMSQKCCQTQIFYSRHTHTHTFQMDFAAKYCTMKRNFQLLSMFYFQNCCNCSRHIDRYLNGSIFVMWIGFLHILNIFYFRLTSLPMLTYIASTGFYTIYSFNPHTKIELIFALYFCQWMINNAVIIN